MAEIKISDLSIGDWVRVKSNGNIIKIAQINGDVDEVRAFGYEHFYSFFSLSDIEPIPLTPEILEKNGFVKNGKYNEWNIGTWRTPYLLGVSLERPAITIKWNGSSIFIDQAKYVHELQHALRLAGVEKEIEV